MDDNGMEKAFQEFKNNKLCHYSKENIDYFGINITSHSMDNIFKIYLKGIKDRNIDHILVKYLNENNMASIDWNALNADAEGRKKNAQELADYAIKTSQGKDIVVLLMHDTYGKEETAKALPTIIKYFKDNGYEIKKLS